MSQRLKHVPGLSTLVDVAAGCSERERALLWREAFQDRQARAARASAALPQKPHTATSATAVGARELIKASPDSREEDGAPGGRRGPGDPEEEQVGQG